MPRDPYTTNTDPKRADSQVVVDEFNGMAPSQDPHQGDPRLSAFQVNAFSLHPGELRCRQGIKQVSFTS